MASALLDQHAVLMTFYRVAGHMAVEVTTELLGFLCSHLRPLTSCSCHGSPGPLILICGVGGGGVPSLLFRARLHFSTGILLSP